MRPATARAFLTFRRCVWPWCADVTAAALLLVFIGSLFSAHSWLPRLAEALR